MSILREGVIRAGPALADSDSSKLNNCLLLLPVKKKFPSPVADDLQNGQYSTYVTSGTSENTVVLYSTYDSIVSRYFNGGKKYPHHIILYLPASISTKGILGS